MFVNIHSEKILGQNLPQVRSGRFVAVRCLPPPDQALICLDEEDSRTARRIQDPQIPFFSAPRQNPVKNEVNLRNQRLRIVMLTGDSKPIAAAIAQKLGIDEFEAEVLPERKSEDDR